MMSERSIDPKLLFRLVIGGDFAKLKEDGFVARRGLPPIPITFPMNWRSKDSNVEFNLHAWRFLSAAWSYYIKNQSYETAKEVFDFSISVARDWLFFLETKKSKYAWYDMSAGIRAMHVAFMKYLCLKHDVCGWEDESIVDRLAEEHIAWLSKQGNVTKGNHAIYQVVGLRVLYELYEDHDLESYLNENMESLVDAAFDACFVSTENSPFYHGYNLDLFKRVSPSLFPKLKRKLEDCISEGQIINKWLTSPTGEYYRIGDTEGDGVKLSTQDAEQEGFSNPSDPVYKDLGKSGYQVVRSHPACEKNKSFALVFRGASPSKVHAHCDALSFIFYYRGKEVFADPGKYTYEYGKQRSWVVSDSSHNTAGLEGSGFLPADVNYDDVFLHPLISNGGAFALSGVAQKGAGFNHVREIDFRPGESLTLRDRVSSNHEEMPEVRLYLGVGFRIKNSVGGFYVYAGEELMCKVLFSGDIDDLRFFNEDEASAYVSLAYGEKTFVSGFVIKCSSREACVKTQVIFNSVEEPEVKKLTHLHLKEISEKAPGPICRDGIGALLKYLRQDSCLKNLLNMALNGSSLEVSSVYSPGIARCTQSFAFSVYNAFEFRDGVKVFYIIQNISFAFPFVIYLPDEGLVFSNRSSRESFPLVKLLFEFVEDSESFFSGVSTSDVKLGGVIDGYPRPYHYFYDMAPFLSDLLVDDMRGSVSVFYTKDRPAFFNHSEVFESLEAVFLDRIEDANRLGVVSFMPSRGYWPKVRFDKRQKYVSLIKSLLGADESLNKKYKRIVAKAKSECFVWLGLCDEKRSWVESEDFYRKVIGYLAKKHDHVFVAVDGLTDTVPSSLRKDKEALSGIGLSSEPNVEFIDLRCSPAKEKIFLGGLVDFFITNSLTDSMWVAYFSGKPGLGFSARGARIEDHVHPKTKFFPEEVVHNLGDEKNWSKTSFSIDPEEAFFLFESHYLSGDL